jgi:hypothetical protein
MFKNITLEMSLKPFKRVDDEYIRQVCIKVFEQWKPLVKDADVVSIMFWTADGSEILEYKGDMTEEIEWCRYIGGANPREGWNKDKDPDGLGLHTRNYLYIENPPIITYGILKKIISIVKETGKEILGDKIIHVGETFDPGPEFAKSDFKYNRHNEICVGESMGESSMVCCYSLLNADKVSYAGFKDGIPEGTPFGTFLGRQSQIFLTDMGFDYLWLSNGLGFGTETWGTTGAIFDGKKFNVEKFEQVRDNVLEFWKLFRKECPYFPLKTRGTNLSTGIDLATDGVPLRDIYKGDFNILPPPNSPWASMDGDFGLELMGNMSRIAELPGDEYLFRYYIHDPWWVNSPWYDRYEGQPHDIYLPLATARIDENGNMNKSTHFNALTIDNSYGDMPDSCVTEPLPHILKALKDAPDSPSPVVWVYPFNEYHLYDDEKSITEMFFGDWYIRGAINNGLPLSSVVSTDNFIKSYNKKKDIYDASILVSTVLIKGSEYEDKIFEFIKSGGKVIFYGSVDRASDRLLNLLNISVTNSISGECKLKLEMELDKFIEYGYSDILNHRELVCAGGINTVLKDENSNVKALGYAEDKVIGTYGENFVWLRGTSSNKYEKGQHLLSPDNANEYFNGEILMRHALAKMGYFVAFQKENPTIKNPVVMINRSDNAYMFSTYSPNTTVQEKFKFPLGAPIIMGYETKLVDGFSTYNFPRAEHKECRVFVEQQSGIVSCREVAPISYQMRRRIETKGLINATVRLFAEKYCEGNIEVLINTDYPNFVGEPFVGEWKNDKNGIYYEVKNVTGSLMLSMPVK